MDGRCRSWWLFVLSGGCGPSTASDGDADTTSAASTDEVSATGPSVDTTASSTASSITAATTASDDTTTSSSTSTSTSTSDSGSDDTSSTGDVPPSVCDPQPEMFEVLVEFEIDFPGGGGDIVLDASCVVLAVEQEEATRVRIDLSCDEADEQVPRTVLVTSDPPVALPVAPTDLLQLRVAKLVPIDTTPYDCVALRDTDGELVVGRYDTRCPADLVDPATWLAPFALELRMDVCEPEPYEGPEGGNFIQDPCAGPDERGAFALGFDDDTLVYDRGTAELVGFDVRVPTAIRHTPLDVESCGIGPYDQGIIVAQRPAP